MSLKVVPQNTGFVPKGTVCVEESEWIRTDDEGRRVACWMGTYHYGGGRLAGFLSREVTEGGDVDEFFMPA